MDDAVVYLVPLGRNRYELYSEPPDDDEPEPMPTTGAFRPWFARLRERWRVTVHAARHAGTERGTERGSFARMRDWVVCRIAESVAEQRTLWSLRSIAAVELRYPADLEASAAVALMRGLLAHARRHHGIWALVDGVIFAAAGLLTIIPGPNLLAYYFGFRFVGHFLSWRGARQGLDRTIWRPHAEPALAELATLVDEPRESRATQVEAIASRLNLSRLAAFFDRTAVSG